MPHFCNDLSMCLCGTFFIVKSSTCFCSFTVRHPTNARLSNIYIYKNMSMLEKEVRDPKIKIQHFLKLMKGVNYVNWSRRRDNLDVMRDIFWVHPNLVKLWNIFSIMLIMDITYKTNKYKSLLLKIVGMTSIELTFPKKISLYGI